MPRQRSLSKPPKAATKSAFSIYLVTSIGLFVAAKARLPEPLMVLPVGSLATPMRVNVIRLTFWHTGMPRAFKNNIEFIQKSPYHLSLLNVCVNIVF
jgi:hypothetical protein